MLIFGFKVMYHMSLRVGTFPKAEHLKSQKQIEQLFQSGTVVKAFPIRAIFEYTDRQEGQAKIQAAVSVSKRNFKRAVDRNRIKRLMREESINGEAIIDNPVFRDRLLKLEGRVLAMQYNDMRLLSAKINRNQDVRLASMIVKLIGTELRHEIECLGIDVMGEIGLSYGDNPHVRGRGSWQYQYMFYLGLIIGGGTSQIQKNIISERGLGMPKEPKIPAASAK